MPFRCHTCGTVARDVRAVCVECGGFVRYEEDDPDSLRAAVSGDPRAALPSFDANVSMGEGDTPTIPFERVDLAPTVYGKLESLNPTCSFKDRGSALAVSAIADPSTTWEGVVVASTGNTAPSVAAYAARCDLPCAVLVPEGTSLSKLAQVDAHGVNIYTIDGTFSDCFQFAERTSNERVLNGTAVYSANPFVASANRTVAFEIVAQLGEAPDWVSVPVGAGPLLGGTQQGFAELVDAGIVDQQPRMLCVQARGCHPIVRAVENEEPVQPWSEPITTTVGAIADPLTGYTADGEETRRSIEESDGDAVALDDETIHTWTDHLARREGVYAESASAASIAGTATNPVDAADTVVGLVTAHGLKESDDDELSTAQAGSPDGLREALLG